MEYPHAKFLRYLVSKKFSDFEIAEECAALGLIPPNDVDLRDLRHTVGLIPASWTAKLPAEDSDFCAWLQDSDLWALWKPDRDMIAATGFLHQGRLRQDFEALMLLHGDPELARIELEYTHTSRHVPSLEALEMFCHYFWDTSPMSRPGLWKFLEANKDQEFKLAAMDGELEFLYASRGLKKKVLPKELYERFLQLVDLETVVLLKQGGTGSGQRAAGHAALMKTAFAVMDRNRDMGVETAADDLRADAAIFKTRIIRRKTSAIPSIDELRRGEFIDAEFTDAPDEDHGGEGKVVSLRPRG